MFTILRAKFRTLVGRITLTVTQIQANRGFDLPTHGIRLSTIYARRNEVSQGRCNAASCNRDCSHRVSHTNRTNRNYVHSNHLFVSLYFTLIIFTLHVPSCPMMTVATYQSYEYELSPSDSYSPTPFSLGLALGLTWLVVTSERGVGFYVGLYDDERFHCF